ncbi:Hypothetical protein NTJ_01269 [Nesidiocoris tenuis]|uniref:Uncharacterized protein n=1 Tax=Nesidiocoris tenuis TaxID=355587 RepID=A0ABN7A919_9HEMI|nr:Hypothetical protein NTJ_01269 [Nesidiocoris tenuis]
MSGSRRGLGKSTKLTKKDADGLKEGKTKQFAKVYQPAAYEDNDPISSPPQGQPNLQHPPSRETVPLSQPTNGPQNQRINPRTHHSVNYSNCTEDVTKVPK